MALAGCAKPLPVNRFTGPPDFNPVAFFTGHVTSWGVEENRAGAPIAIVTTDCAGTPDGPEAITMVQRLHIGETTQLRTWHLARSGPGQYTATANDMAGSTMGTASGRAFHWRWVLKADPGNGLANVTMDQWMYQMSDGAVMIRTIVTKAGFRLLEVSEQFQKGTIYLTPYPRMSRRRLQNRSLRSQR